jgi:SnoaL-like domain
MTAGDERAQTPARKGEGVAPELPVPAWGHGRGVLDLQIQSAFESAFASTSPPRPPELERALLEERPARYCWGYDERRLDVLEDCFTEDAVWLGTVAGGDAVGPLQGREAIVRWLTEFWPHQHHQARHVLMNTVIESVDAQTASTLSYLLLASARRGRAKIETTGFYRMSLVSTAGDWKIARLFAGFDAPFWPGRRKDLSERGRRRHGLFD